MDINLVDVNILIKSENLTKVIENFRRKFNALEDVGTENINTIEDVGTENINTIEDVGTENINTIEDVFFDFGYNIIQNDNGDITDLDAVSSDLPDGQEEFFDAIAPFVENGSYICQKREDEHWKFVFENGKVNTLDGEIVYRKTEMTYDRATGLINDFIDHLCDVKRISEAIEELLGIGITAGELVDVFDFDKTDVDSAVSTIGEDE